MPILKADSFAIVPYLIFGISEPPGGWIAGYLIRFGSFAMLVAGTVRSDSAAIWFIGVASTVGLATGNILALLQRIAPEDQVGLWMGMSENLYVCI